MKLRQTIESRRINIAISDRANIKNNNVDNHVVIVLDLVYIINEI